MGTHGVEIGQVQGRPKVEDGPALPPPNDLSEGFMNGVSRPRGPERIGRLPDELRIKVDRRMLPHAAMICMRLPQVNAVAIPHTA